MSTLAVHEGDFVRKPSGDGSRCYLDRITPTVGVDTADLSFVSPDLLSANSTGTPPFLRFHFPAAFSPPPFEHVLATDEFPNHRLYRTICAEITKGTKPLVVVGPTREWRLPVCIAPEMRDWIAAHPILTTNGLRLK